MSSQFLRVKVANKLQQAFGKRFRRIITNSPDGVPEWLTQIENGNDFGLFKPTDAPWVVHGDLATLVGGIRALLMQALHPGSLAGVAQHSRYEQDPLGRLAGTTKWLTILTFGSKEAIAQESARVNGMHKQVVGQYEDKPGHKKDYAASDQDLLLWVHIAFTDSFLIAHEFYGARAIPNGSDAYVSLWSKAVEPLGLAQAPQTRNELKITIQNFDPLLRADQKTLDVVKFIKKPPLSRAARFAYAIMFQAAAVTIEPKYLRILGIKVWPKFVVVPVTKLLLNAMRLALGGISPLEEAAIARHNRLRSN